MTTFYFIRHAESAANDKNILASQLDFPLSERGEKDISIIAKRFQEKYSIDYIVSSPLKRALQTAKAFSDIYNLEIKPVNHLIEQNLGIYAGMTYDEIKTAKGYEHDRTKRWEWVPEKGESYQMISQRVLPFFEQFNSQTYNNKNILVVTHAVTMRLIRGILENTLPNYPEEIAKNGEIWKVNYSGTGKNHKIEAIFFDTENIRAHGE